MYADKLTELQTALLHLEGKIEKKERDYDRIKNENERLEEEL